MSSFVAEVKLVTNQPPCFAGWFERIVTTLGEGPVHAPFLPSEVLSVVMRLYKLERYIPSTFGEEIAKVPIPGFESYPIPNEVIIPAQTLPDATYKMLGKAPFLANFWYSPPVTEVKFTDPGEYLARFEIEAENGVYPVEIKMEVV